jgi:hypothetical protein
VLLGMSAEIIREVSDQLTAWWKANAKEAIDWLVRIPVFAASLPLLGWAGADMTVATTAVGAMVGSEKVVAALTRRTSKRKK